MIKDGEFRNLIVGQKAMAMVREIYEISNSWPHNEQFGLTSQTRKSAVSVLSNIAGGKGRSGSREYLHHFPIAHGSPWELETQLQLAHDFDYMPEERLLDVLGQTEEVGRLLRGLNRSLNSTQS